MPPSPTPTSMPSFACVAAMARPRLLDALDFDLLRANPKPFVGYSDITALHLAINRYAGFVTFHGPMLNADLLGGKQPPTESSLFSLLRGQRGAGSVLPHPMAYPLTTIEPGVACGRLLGGNLSMIAAVMGTPYELDADGIILFIEDVNEPLYRIDRSADSTCGWLASWLTLPVCW